MFRSVRLLRLAAQAETLRWKRTGRGFALRAGLGAGAAVFGLMLLLMLHLAVFAALAKSWGPVTAALVIAGADLVIAGIFGWLASRDLEDPIAVEAERVRDDALRQVGDSAARAAMVAPLLRGQTAKKGLIGAAVTAAVIGLMTRR